MISICLPDVVFVHRMLAKIVMGGKNGMNFISARFIMKEMKEKLEARVETYNFFNFILKSSIPTVSFNFSFRYTIQWQSFLGIPF